MSVRFLVLAGLVFAAVTFVVPAANTAGGTDTSALRNAVTVDGVMAHEQAFQEIANQNDGTRASGTSGYDDSASYVANKLLGAGYQVTVQQFTYDQFRLLGPSVFARISPTPRTYVESVDGDYLAMQYSGSGDFTALLARAGGIVIPSPGGSTSGCSSGDFAGFPAGSIALIQRGTCTFRIKATNAQAAGAVAVVIFNEGNNDPEDDRFGPINGTLDPPQDDIPVIGTSFAVGQELNQLVQQGPVTVRVKVDAGVVTTPSANVIADTPTGRADRVVVVGSHLDSVPEGPGINDNGSGSAADLEVALQLARLGIQPTNKVRFAFWGAEEDGLIGSAHYVANLSNKERHRIALNLNFDMVGSTNFVRFVYDGDGSAFGTDGPSGSGTIEDTFTDYFDSIGLPTAPTEFDGRSDYDAFISNGIPAGGLFTGAEGIKTAEEAAIFGGTAGAPHDPCYHQACDTIDNLSSVVLDQMSDAIAHATLTFAMTRSAVNGTDNANNDAKAKIKWHGPFLKK